MNFEWPSARDATLAEIPPHERRPLARHKRDRLFSHAHLGGADLCQLLEAAEATITRLEADRRTARTRIEELERTEANTQARLIAQRRRLLLLERQLEGAGIEPAVEPAPASSSWLDRLFGGPSSVIVR